MLEKYGFRIPCVASEFIRLRSVIDLFDLMGENSVRHFGAQEGSMLPRMKFNLELVRNMTDLAVFAKSMTRNRSDSEDLVAQTIERALNNWQSHDPERSMKTWLFTIMRNIHSDNIRKSTLRNDYVQGTDTLPEVVDYSQNFDRESHRAAVTAIEQLPPEQRSALYLVRFDGLSYKEAGEILNVSEGTVKSRVSRARESVAIALTGVSGKDRENEGLALR